MTKQETYAFLTEQGISCEITEHAAVFNMEELDAVDLPYPDRDAKNLFVRDDKKRNYYLITVKDDKRVDLREFSQRHGTRKLSFASADDLLSLLGLIPGAVTPLRLKGIHTAAEPVDVCRDQVAPSAVLLPFSCFKKFLFPRGDLAPQA